MSIAKSISGKVVLLLFTIFIVSFAPKLKNIASGEDRCLCAYDGYGYYLYIPHFFEKGTLDIQQEWAQELQNDYCNGTYAYQIVRTEKGKELNVYHMGQAFVELPSYILGDLSARLFGYKTDGFSKPYYIFFIVNVLFFILLGLLYTRKTLLLFLSDRHTAITLLVLYLASNIYITFFLQYDLQHLYLFALNAIFMYHLVQFIRTKTRKHIILSAIVLGLTVAIRPTQVLLGIFPLIILLREYRLSRSFLQHIWLYPAFGLLWNVPQIAYWWIIGGEPFIPNLHSERIVLSDPNIIDFLFSYKKGWLLYSPLFLLILPGLYILYKQNRSLFWSFILFIPFYIWVMSSWECWWYASSYGSRVMVDIYPLLIILVGLSIAHWKKTFIKVLGATFLISACLLNMLQTHQGMKGYLSFDSMTKQHYWYIFGKIDIPDYTGVHLELNRGVVDSAWIDRAKTLPNTNYSYTETLIYELVEPVRLDNNLLFLTDLVVLDKLPSDEAMLEIQVSCATGDSTQSALLMFETFTPESLHWYNWSPVELSLGRPQDTITQQTHYINVQRMRHRSDKLNIYLNSSNSTLEVQKLTITAHSLERK